MNAPAASAPGPADAKRRTEEALRAFHEEGALGKAYDARLLRRLWPFVRPYRGLLFLSIGLGLVMAALSLSRPYVMQQTVDRGALGHDERALFWGGLVFTVVILIEQVLSFVQSYAVQVSGARGLGDLRREVLAFLHGRRLAFFDRQPVGRVVTRGTHDHD
jgi:ATP-binding cassette subfamily B protein